MNADFKSQLDRLNAPRIAAERDVSLSRKQGRETAPPAEAGDSSPANRTGPRKFLGVYFRCCTIYSRIYKNATGTAYEGRCPRCGKPTKILIGTGGTSNRFFEAE
jgi:hypothetical protein